MFWERWFRSRRWEQKLDGELRFHIEQQIQKNIRAGDSPEEARRKALIEFGGLDQVKEECREQQPLAILENGLRDIKYALRGLTSTSLFSISVIFTIALTVGVSSTIFSLTNAVLLRPLPYRDPERLVHVLGDMPSSNNRDMPLSFDHLRDLQNEAKDVFDDLTGVSADTADKATLRRPDGTPEQLAWADVRPNFFRVMGIPILKGRDFEEADAQPEQPLSSNNPSNAQNAQRLPMMAILSYEYWQRAFGGDATIFGKSVNGLVVVGVLAPTSELFFPPDMDTSRSPDLWIARRDPTGFHVIGRLKQGVSIARAQSKVEAIAAEIQGTSPNVEGVPRFHFRLEPMQHYLSQQAQPAIIAIMAASLFLLFIASTNVANLFLVRAQSRKRLFALRSALGASRPRLITPIVVEAVLLAGAAAPLGFGIASLAIHEIVALAPPGLPRIDQMRIGNAELVFGLLSSLLIAAVPAILWMSLVSQIDLRDALAGGSRVGPSKRTRLFNNCLVVAEVMFAFALLVSSGLMTRSWAEIRRTDPGYDPGHILTFVLAGRYLPEPLQQRALSMRIRDRLHGIPGITSVGFAGQLPLADMYWPADWADPKAPTDLSKVRTADVQVVTPGYFETLRIRLLAGRLFTDEDNMPGQHGVIVDQLFAEKAFPNESAVGKRILISHFRAAGVKPEWAEILGIVNHERATSLSELGREQLFFTDCFLWCDSRGRWVLRTQNEPLEYIPTIREALAGIDSRLAPLDLQPMAAFVDRARARTTFEFLLLGFLAIAAALLASVGIYGVLSTAVRSRSAEIGMRIALGALPKHVFLMVVRQGIQVGLIGIFLGSLLAVALGRAMSSMLVGVNALDPTTFLAVAFLSIGLISLASSFPAWRAARVDPVQALRAE